jgi:hypothetical protein
VPGDWWFPEPRSVINELVVRVCEGCPVRRNCLLFALQSPEIWHGIWGGLSAGEIARVRQRILEGQPPAVVLDDAEVLATNRGARTVYLSGVLEQLPGQKELARVRGQLREALCSAGLLPTDPMDVDTSDRAA